MSTDKAPEFQFLNRLLEKQRQTTKMPLSMEAVTEFLGFTNWPFNLDDKHYRKGVNLDPGAAKQIWEAALQKSTTASINPEKQLRFLILTLWCLQVLQEPEGDGREVKIGDFLFLDSADKPPIEGQKIGGIGASARR